MAHEMENSDVNVYHTYLSNRNLVSKTRDTAVCEFSKLFLVTSKKDRLCFQEKCGNLVTSTEVWTTVQSSVPLSLFCKHGQQTRR